MTTSQTGPATDAIVADSVRSAAVQVAGLTKRYTGRHAGSTPAVDGVFFEVGEGEFFSLLGPSGCGKSTTLRCIAGLESANEGSITVGGRTLYSSEQRINVPANRRGLGIVFQSYAIWPHMTVLQNVVYALRANRRQRRERSRAEALERGREMLEVVELGDFAARPATQLSGGQQQRLALARALIARPKVLLLDEPLSSLDAKLRERIAVELKRLQSELRITTIFVTHDQTEALELSDRMAVMCDGKIEHTGTPREIYQRPASAFVAEFVGTSNQLRGTVAGSAGDSRVEIDLAGGLRLLAETGGRQFTRGENVVAVGRPERLDFRPTGAPEPAPNAWQAEVTADLYQGHAVEYVVTLPGGPELRVLGKPTDSWEAGTQGTVYSAPDAWSAFRV